MNFITYLVTLVNMQNFSSGPLKDISIKAADVGSLANEFKNFPQFNIEVFDETGFYRVGDIGIFMSNNVISYIENEDVDPNDDGLMIILYYEKAPDAPTSTGADDGTAAFLHCPEFTDKVNEYLETHDTSDRHKRSTESTSNGIHKNDFSEKLKKYFDSLNIYGRSKEFSPDFISQIEAKQGLINEKDDLSKHFKKVFDDANIYGRDLKDLKSYLDNLKH